MDDFSSFPKYLMYGDSRDKFVRKISLKRFIAEVLDIITGASSIREVPQTVTDTVVVANRICRFVSGDNSFGTGFLIGADQVLTAAHLFFDTSNGVLRMTADQLKKLKVEFDTMVFTPSGLMSVGVATEHLANDSAWAVDPKINMNGAANREVADLDYAIVKLTRRVGDDPVGPGEKKRGFFQIPASSDLPPLREGKMLQIVQYNDRAVLRSSIGRVEGVSQTPRRVRYSASTLDASSGSAVFDDRFRLIALHVSGASEDFPRQNQGLPLRKIVENIPDKVKTELNNSDASDGSPFATVDAVAAEEVTDSLDARGENKEI